MYYFCYKTIIGIVTICANENAITGLYFGEYRNINADNTETEIIKKAFTQLEEYLNGSRESFDIKLEYTGSVFQSAVWDQLKTIPYGKTKTYKEVAGKLGNFKASVAVGSACGKNPISIFIPCHRVIGSSGNLTGYAGGVSLKKKLLEIERHKKINNKCH